MSGRCAGWGRLSLRFQSNGEGFCAVVALKIAGDANPGIVVLRAAGHWMKDVGVTVFAPSSGWIKIPLHLLKTMPGKAPERHRKRTGIIAILGRIKWQAEIRRKNALHPILKDILRKVTWTA